MQNDNEWIAAAGAVALLKSTLGERRAQRAICKRAHDGMLRARAERFTIDGTACRDTNIPKEFWWAEGESALTQDWGTGDFDTWIKHQKHWRAFGVCFHSGDVEKLIPVSSGTNEHPPTSESATQRERATMDEMEWAIFGLKYLRDARRSKHDELNEAMKELNESAPAARAEPSYRVCKNVLPHFYHYSDEFPADGKIPGEKFASPQDFAIALAEYRAFLEQMRRELNDADLAYRNANNIDGPPFLVGAIREHVEYTLKAIEHVAQKKPGTISTGLIDDMVLAERLVTRFHESVLALGKHPHGGALFQVQSEWDCQYLFHSILRAYFSDVRPEEFNPSFAGSSSRCEFFLKDQRLMIELKYVRAAGDQKTIKSALLTDFADYGGNPSVDYVIVLVYDPSSKLPGAVQLQNDLVGPFKYLKRVQVIVSPPRF